MSLIKSLLIFLFIGPLLTLFWWQGTLDFEILEHIWSYTLGPSIIQTVILVLGVSFICYGLGTLFCGWLFYFSGPFRNFLLLLLVLPLAWPSLNLAYLQRDFFSYSGFLMSFLREYQWPIFSVAPLFGAILSLSTGLMPYVLVAGYFGFFRQQSKIVELTKTWSLESWQIRKHLILPAIFRMSVFPLIAVGFEVLSDFGAVSVWNVDSLSALILKTWFSMFSIQSAKFLSWLILFAAISLILIRWIFTRKTYEDLQFSAAVDSELILKKDYFYFVGCIFFILYLSVAYIAPLASLTKEFKWEFFVNFFNESVFWSLNSLGTQLLLVLLIAVILIGLHAFLFTAMTQRWLIARPIFYLGYALPGTILVVAFLPLFSWIKMIPGWSQSYLVFFFLILWAYVVKYANVGLSLLDGHSKSLNRSIEEILSFRTTETSQFSKWLILCRYHFGQIFPVILILWIDILKELPLMLALRPFGFNTLMTKSYDLISEGFWAQAMPFSVLLFILGAIGVWSMLYFQRMRVHNE